jgi:hypothetical protein
MSVRYTIALFLLCITKCSYAAELTPEQEKQFAELENALTGSVLVGHFTVTGAEASEPKAERYELTSVKHISDGNWMFVARIQYGEHDVMLPITLPVKWAGDTPVITVDKMAFPGLGTYTARVMIYEDHYAGFWSGGDHGGHLYGLVEHGKPAAPAVQEKPYIKSEEALTK